MANPPKPPTGKRWVMDPDFSDEFNGIQLDATKWLDHHPTWMGREPGLFLPSQISVKDGYLQIKGEKMKKDTIVHAYGRDLTFNVACGAVVSKKSTFLGYYECRLKAAATTMSTTFWFSSDKGAKGPNDCDNYGLEWDIQECIGRSGSFTGSFFAKGMHSNSHFWYTDCDKKKYNHTAPDVRYEDSELASKDFHVCGGWWQDESTASYYYDNREAKHQKFYDLVKKKPFDRPMVMRLVSETYPFPWIELPTDEELADNTKNTAYYDWVRGYKLIDANDPNTTKEKPESEINLYNESIIFNAAILELNSAKVLKIPLAYQVNQDREIRLVLFDTENKKIKEVLLPAYVGYANLEYDFKLNKELAIKDGYKLVATLRKINSDPKDKLDSNTIYINISK